ncbi:hypothetical protein D9611_005886 [Ephemerocybe angulata]|uniref:DUF6533 domain-containing protein n=1 Tax=Ephemerocybe angulata TaxID=980116 RepID=A0A8H5FLQ9_9AGAR|nr:hypothetical protein D9611_005886 [Tulosesus angulatus]
MASAINPVVIGESLIATKYAYAASATILFWDIALTVDQEYQRVWKAKKTLGTTLFFCNRYLPPAIFLLDLLGDGASSIPMGSYNEVVRLACLWEFSVFTSVSNSCKNYEYSSTLLDFISIAIVECVLIMRTHALYQSTLLLVSLAVLGLLSIVNMLICFLIIIKQETFVPASALGLVGCLSGCTGPMCKPLLIAFWVPFLVFETTIFTLTAWKSFKTFRLKRQSGSKSARLIEILFRDGLIYYLVIMATSLMNFFIWILDPFASYLAVGLLKCLQATICTRLLLNIRGMLEPQNLWTTVTTQSDGIALSTPSDPSRRGWLKPTNVNSQPSSWDSAKSRFLGQSLESFPNARPDDL